MKKTIIIASTLFFCNYAFAQSTTKPSTQNDAKYEWVGDVYEYAHPFSEGLAVAENQLGGYEVIDTKGKMVIDGILYSSMYPFSDGLAIVRDDDYKYGAIDKTGKVIIKPTFSFLLSFSEGLAQFSTDKGIGFIDKTGKVVIEATFPKTVYIKSFKEGLALIKKNDKFGFIDKTGKEAIPATYDYAKDFSEGFALVKKDFEYFFIDKNGKESKHFGIARSFSNGLAAVTDFNGKMGFVNNKFEFVIPAKYEYVADFSENSCLAKIKDYSWVVLDKKGKELELPSSTTIQNSSAIFVNGYAVISRNTIMDKTGNTFDVFYKGTNGVEKNVSEIELSASGIALVKVGEYYHYMKIIAK